MAFICSQQQFANGIRNRACQHLIQRIKIVFLVRGILKNKFTQGRSTGKRRICIRIMIACTGSGNDRWCQFAVMPTDCFHIFNGKNIIW